ncbi:uncharacterized protein LOC122243849, partial [Penaeus japonicus]|uniref:uncharacterized protein LOC122243849 n=1 Tax=Penaeus japonicus TaxID=27405 RepID=UPI001C713CD3
FMSYIHKSVKSRVGHHVCHVFARLSVEERTSRAVAGKFAIVEPKYYIKAIIAKNFTNYFGYTPLHVGRKEYDIFAGLAFGYRRGAPFLSKFSQMKQRMVEAGLMKHWIDDVFKDYSLKVRMAKLNSGEVDLFPPGSNGGPVVLSLPHLQGAFYLLFIGHACAFLSLLGERMLAKDRDALRPMA